MRNQKFLVSFAAIVLLSLRVAAAQHAGHQMPAGSPAGEAADACGEHSRQGLQIIESANRRLEESRQSNNPTKMRAAMDELQGALGQLRTHLSLCVSAMPAAQKEGEQTDHSKMGHEAMGEAKPPASSRPPTMERDHSKVPSREPAAAPKTAPKSPGKTDHSQMGHDKPSTQSTTAPAKEATDPVCGMKVNSKTDLRTEYGGKTYYFCSESDRERFLKEPKSFVGNQ